MGSYVVKTEDIREVIKQMLALKGPLPANFEYRPELLEQLMGMMPGAYSRAGCSKSCRLALIRQFLFSALFSTFHPFGALNSARQIQPRW